MGGFRFGFLKNKSRNQEGESIGEKSKSQKVELDLRTLPESGKMLSIIDLTEEDLQILKQLRDVVQPNIEEITEGFYSIILENPELAEIIGNNTTVDRLKGTLNRHINEIFNARFDEEYVNRRLQVAYVHYKIGLRPKWYIGSFQLLQTVIIQHVIKSIETQKDNLLIIKALTKVFNFEQQIVLEAYFRHFVNELEKELEVNKEVSEQIAETSATLAEIGQEIDNSIEELKTSSGEVVTTVQQMAELAGQTQTSAHEGHNQIGVLTQKITEIADRTKKLREVFSELTVSSEEIQKVINLVKDVADQTNLLALNSAIEAARAGEHGRGFSVVAQEVRKLSDETKDLVEKVTSLVTDNREHITSAETTLDSVGEVITEGISESEITKTSFDKIITSMDNSIISIESVVSDVGSLVKGVQQLSDGIETVTRTTEELNEATRRRE